VTSSPETWQRGAAVALERLGRVSLRAGSMDDLLRTVTDLAGSLLPGRPDASVSLIIGDSPTTAASTGDLAVDLDESQYERGYGPCLHAARTGELTEIRDTRIETRWEDYARQAARKGNLSSLSVPLAIDSQERIAGALNIYARDPQAFHDDSRAAAVAFGSYAAVAAGDLHAYQSARSRAENLQIALDNRAVIDQAKGILMERHRLTPDQAFQLLARRSMDSNRKVRDVAEHLVHTGELPATPPGGRNRPAGDARPGRRGASGRGPS
jgi:GAF domain-containing protein